ncbi:hypothetical protein [Lactobacillus corticis]|uniref:Uncharacterized protein n=1 Tax=Lactobacillus corticis TaxID=2201249 RepID=A0A916VIJ8_9LACO|nr:hypothetical protein [Lactobacillus corticis]GFZ27373.1 hypothetical protein LCB40_12530 [Lactobacillus corticis]
MAKHWKVIYSKHARQDLFNIEDLNYMPQKSPHYPEEKEKVVQIIRIMYSGQDASKHLTNSSKTN